MKKSIFVLAGVAMLALASCKKEYTCECTTTSAIGTISATTTIKDTKNNATEACEAGSSSTNVGGMQTTVTCKIK